MPEGGRGLIKLCDGRLEPGEKIAGGKNGMYSGDAVAKGLLRKEVSNI